MMQAPLPYLQSGKTFSEEHMVSIMSEVMNGEWNNETIAAFLMGLSMRGETIDEICGAARVMREMATPIKAPENAVDCCGTGGDKSGTYNISTAVAIVSAACGVPIAKHGNRAASSKSGAADVLEALGINLDTSHEKLEEALKQFNFAFLMAPSHHSAMRHVVPVRKAMKVRTIFNMLGPLANPAGTKFQLIGVYDRALLQPMAQVLQKLGTTCAWVVHGSDGLDEITTTGETYCAKLENGKITETIFHPKDFGLDTSKPEDLLGGDPEYNAAAIKTLLAGEKNAYRDIVLANTSAVLNIAGKEKTLKNGVEKAAEAIDSGKAKDLLRSYTAFTHENA